MDLMRWVEEFSWFQWLFFFLIVGYIIMWGSKNSKFIEVDNRFLKIDKLDEYYYMFGEWSDYILFFRNALILGVLILTFVLIT